MAKVVIVGTGAYATSLGNWLIEKENDLILYGIVKSEINDINNNCQNKKFFKGKKLNKDLKATSDLKMALTGVEYVFLAVPSDAIRTVVALIIKEIKHPIIWINLAKGFDYQSHNLIAPILDQIIPKKLNHGIVKVAGPSFALEIIHKVPTSFTIACKNLEIAKQVQNLFDIENIVTETTDDIIGVEIASVVKNSLAIFLGIVKGLDYKTNGLALFLVLSIQELQKLKKIYPSIKRETFLGFCGLGDMFLTGTSKKSRNFEIGYKIGRKNKMIKLNSISQTVEGIRSITTLLEISKKNKVELTLISILDDIFQKRLEPKESINKLLKGLRKVGYE